MHRQPNFFSNIFLFFITSIIPSTVFWSLWIWRYSRKVIDFAGKVRKTVGCSNTRASCRLLEEKELQVTHKKWLCATLPHIWSLWRVLLCVGACIMVCSVTTALYPGISLFSSPFPTRLRDISSIRAALCNTPYLPTVFQGQLSFPLKSML